MLSNSNKDTVYTYPCAPTHSYQYIRSYIYIHKHTQTDTYIPCKGLHIYMYILTWTKYLHTYPRYPRYAGIQTHNFTYNSNINISWNIQTHT